ncbi:MAG: AmmeMemoRadiSam system protein B [Phycisphaerales bacterium]|nr:AmmeMemoRadiSam system protein B [Phycisphaerales bacterium]
MSEQKVEFDPSAAHHAKPRLRQVEGFPFQQEEKVLLGLRDPHQVSREMVFVAPQAQHILPHMNGANSLDDIAEAVGHGLTSEMLKPFVAQLDQACLLFGPRFDALVRDMRAEFDASGSLPSGASADMADALTAQKLGEAATDEAKAQHGAANLIEAMDKWFEEAGKMIDLPIIEQLPTAIVAPHLDYFRGWINYAAMYAPLRGLPRPDRVVILGTNHFGFATGVCGCDKGLETPLGACDFDGDFAALVNKHLGSENAAKLIEHRYDHDREHSIELQLPWIQHVFGADESGAFPRVYAALIHDPTRNAGQSYDGKGLDLDVFVDALRAALSEAPGRTLVVSSADLSHVGPMFGDQINLVEESEERKQFLKNMEETDRRLTTLLRTGKVDEMIASLAWEQNATRWCSAGNLSAMMRATGAEELKIVNWVAARDSQGAGIVSSIAAYAP